MAALRDLAEFLGRIPSRRKAVLFLTEDVGVDVASAAETPLSASVNRFAGDIAREMARAALRHNVTIYPIDPGGLDLGDVITGERQSALSIEQDRVRREREVARRANFHALAAVTGGFAVVATNNIDELFARVVRENSAYYLLGYQPSEDKSDGSFRRLQVRVNRPGLQVHTINGYLAPKERVAANRTGAMADLLSVPLSVSGLPMQAVAAPYRSDKNQTAVAAVIEVGGQALRFEQKSGAYTAQLDVGYVASGREGGNSIVQNRINLSLPANTYEKIRATGLRLLLEPMLPPGLHQLRIGVSQAGGASGSVVLDVEAPDFNREEFTLSGVSLTSKLTSSLHVTAGTNAVKDALPGPMTAIRRFAADDHLAAYVEVYDNIQSTAAHSVTVRAELRSADGVVVRGVEQERSSAMLSRKRDGYGFLLELPMAGVPFGPYLFHVEATASVDGRLRQSRDVPIQVVR